MDTILEKKKPGNTKTNWVRGGVQKVQKESFWFCAGP